MNKRESPQVFEPSERMLHPGSIRHLSNGVCKLPRADQLDAAVVNKIRQLLSLCPDAFSAILAFLVLVCGPGCGKPITSGLLITESSKVLVGPGCGVTNVCEVGMTFEQIKHASHNATIHGFVDGLGRSKRSERYILVPGLGAIANVDAKERVELIIFYVQPYDSSITVPGLAVTNPFQGKLGENLSFQDGPVGKNRVEEEFGKIQQGWTAPKGTITNVSVDSIKKGEPLFVVRGDREEMHYPQLGLSFDLKSNVVVSFGVSRPVRSGENR